MSWQPFSRLGLPAGLAAACLVSLTLTVSQSNAALSKRQLLKVENDVLPAYYRGNTLAVLTSVSQLTRRMSDEQVAELDARLAAEDLPPTGDLLLKSRLALLRQNHRQRLPKPPLRELLITLKHIQGELETLLAESTAHPALGDQLPEVRSIQDYEGHLWNLHVIEQRLVSAHDLTEYAKKLVGSNNRVRVDTLDEAEQDLLATDFDAYFTRLADTIRRLSEREVELRIRRVEVAHEILADPEPIKERFLAAWAVDVDGELLLELLNAPHDGEGQRFRSEVLNEEALPGRVQVWITEGRERAGDLLEKSRLLHTGLHWWLRGRYGMGTDGFGLLKSPAAVNSSRAQFALYMPTATPKPTAPQNASSAAVPEVDRRHHYIWAWEYREVLHHSDQKKETIGRSRRATSETTLSRFY